ncbi:GGDEF domain-containing protein [Aliidiomarina sanyensis]|uniref:diguanylate cyclase n=1 Tax=Aliidiomarina sanyensis TaxID=1249555 RepID=A0A432WSA6_9GAMM|nr:GGDEF domain-containing protein [Aliidiomarina sanyensis]RUO36634.1 hypothetical protein CWE11_02145 [Aliidiomarina sanyensis]
MQTNSLTARLLLRVVIASSLVLAIAGVSGFYVSYHQAFQAQVDHLQYDKQQRIAREASVFRQAEDTAALLGHYFQLAYENAPTHLDWEAIFWALHEETEPGVVRLKQDFFDGEILPAEFSSAFSDRRLQSLSSFIGRSDVPLDEERMRRIVIATQLLHRFAPAWQRFYENTHISMPENALIQYSVTQPWGRQARHDLIMTDYSVVRSTLQSENPERLGAWTGLYYDLSSEQWVITYQKPIDSKGKHLGTPSHDVSLASIIDRLIERGDSPAQHLIINTQGQIIAAPATFLDGHQESGIINIETLESPLIQGIWDRLETQSGPFLETLDVHDVLVLAEQVPGPGWWYVTAYPLSAIHSSALYAPIRFVIIGSLFAFLLLVVLYVFVQQQVTKPLKKLTQLTHDVGAHRFEQITELKLQPNRHAAEISALLRSFQQMATRILRNQQHLETEVESRTAELAAANARLHDMAHVDGLTGLLNRRAFNRDLQSMISAATQPKSAAVVTILLLADVDYFKPFNDTYGHVEGDQVLKQLCSAFDRHFKPQAYRFGGEELAAIFEVPLEAAHARAIESAEAAREDIESLNIRHQDSPFKVVTVSFGVTIIQPDDTIESALDRADQALYQAKEAGRNQTIFRSPRGHSSK